jgi:WD40 repeat protein
VFDRGGKLVQRLTHPDLVLQVGWRPDGRLLVVGCEDLRVYVWRMPEGKRHAVLDAGMAADMGVSFSPSGRLLLATSTSNVGQVWDPVGGWLLVQEAGKRLPRTFGPDDRHLGFPPAWELAPAEVCRPIHHTGLADKVGEGEAVRMWGAWFDPPGRRLITLGGTAVLWDLDAGAEVARLPGTMAAFLAGGELIAVRGHRQIVRLAAADDRGGHLLRTLHPNTPKMIARDVTGLSADGHWAAVADPGAERFVLIDPADGRAPVLLDQPDAYDAAFSPDGRLAATSSCWSDKPPPPVRVWEVPAGRLVREVPVGSAALVAFSPDGRWLVVSSTTEYQFWRVGPWEPGLRVPRRGNVPGAMAFSPDGRVLAVVPAAQVLRLIDPDTGGELATLTPPRPSPVSEMRFSPDGSLLAVSTGTAVGYLWDLQLLRRELRAMNLDWDDPRR